MAQKSLSAAEIAQMIDISAVQALHGESEIRRLVRDASKHGFGSVHVLPAWVPLAKHLLEGISGVSLGSPVGFPSGGNHPRIKRAEALQAIADGADELDLMINVGKLRSGHDEYVLHDLRGVIEAADVPVKVILESFYLNEAEIRRACELCLAAGASYVKTSTGWAKQGATLEIVALITSCLEGRIGVKASGGIRDLETVLAMYEMGVRRFGINVRSSVEIVQAAIASVDGTVSVNV